jgi:endonuclease YncB( thermonuclease family)
MIGSPPRFSYTGFLMFAALAAVLLAYKPELTARGTGVAAKPPLTNVSAIDGDSLRSSTEELRIMGIDAPELSQTCRDERGRGWACGREARKQLSALIARGDVRCTPNGRDRYGRTLARCSARAVADIGDSMVRAGYAVDFMNGGYQTAEKEARSARRGIWNGDFERPADYRKLHPRTAQR